MIRCLCCGKSLRNGESNGWHESCIKRFFGSKVIPEINLGEGALESFALQNVRQGLTVPGVQKKMSLLLNSDGKHNKLTLVGYPTGYILKPQAEEYDSLPELEWVGMKMADYAGIATVANALISINDKYAYISKRIDRVFEKNYVKKLAMEDFCQLDSRMTSDKYHGSYERCAKIIQRHSSRSGLDLAELFMRVVFSYIIGNSDMHLKNLSLIETEFGSGLYVLSPAYDLFPVSVVLPEDEDEFALTVNGKRNNVTKNDLYVFGSRCGLSKIACQKMIKKLLSLEDGLIDIVENSVLKDELKSDLAKVIKGRCSALS